MEPLEVAKSVADHASIQSDRWLFISLLVIVFLSLAWLTKWFISRLDETNKATQAAHAALTEHLKTAGIEQTKVIVECRVAMHRMNEIGEEWLAIRGGRRSTDSPV